MEGGGWVMYGDCRPKFINFASDMTAPENNRTPGTAPGNRPFGTGDRQPVRQAPAGARPAGTTRRPDRIALPFDNRRRRAGTGEWIYRHRVGLLVTVVLYLIAAILFVSYKIVVYENPTTTMYVDLVDPDEPQPPKPQEEEVKPKPVERIDPGQYEQVKNRHSDLNAKMNTSLKDDRGTQMEKLLADAERVQQEQAERFSAESSDASWANYSWIPDISIFKPYPKISAHVTENAYLSLWYDEHRNDSVAFAVASAILKRNILWYAMFRAAPVILRPVIYNQGRYWSANTGVEDANKYLSCYSVMEYLPRLTDFNCKTENYFLSFTNNATHTNFMLQAPDYVPAAEITNYSDSEYAHDSAYSSMAGIMHRLAEFFDYLKENGVYNNTRILIVSDHGSSSRDKNFKWDEKFERLSPGRYHPLFMFKDFGDENSFATSDEFMTNADGPAMLLEGFISNPENPFTGEVVTNATKSNGALINTSNLFMPHHTKSKYVLTSPSTDWYRVSKNIFESENWKQELVEEAK